MNDSFQKFAGLAAILTGILSVLYAVFYLIVSKSAPDFGFTTANILLALGGGLSTAVYVALYQRTRGASEGYALWALLLGLTGGSATFVSGIYRALIIAHAPIIEATDTSAAAAKALSEVDPAGLVTFVVFAVASIVFGWLIMHTAPLPRNLGYLAYVNAVLLVLLFIGNVLQNQLLILAPGGLTSLIATPLWWIWLGTQLRK